MGQRCPAPVVPAATRAADSGSAPAAPRVPGRRRALRAVYGLRILPAVSDQPKLLWTPSDERAGGTTLAAYERWLHDSRGLTFGSYEEHVALVGRGARRVLADDRRVLRGPLRRRRRDRAGRPDDARGAVVPGHDRLLSRAHLPRPRRRRGRDPAHLRDPSRARQLDLGRTARADGAGCRGPAGARRRRGRPRLRVHAEHPGDDRVPAGVRVDRRDLVLGGARVRRAQRDRPVRADRAQGAADDRWLPLRRQGLRPLGDRRAGHRRDARAVEGRPPRLPGRQRLGGRVPRPGRRRAVVRPGAVRPPAVGALQLRARPACRRRSSRARAGSCSSSSSTTSCTSTRAPATACSGSRRPAG